MKYYLIVGEASGDLHASNLMRALQHEDPQAEFRFFGGDLMKAVGGTCVKHYRELAYMGFIPVLLHLRTIFRNMDFCKKDVEAWQPDVLILVDYPGFNLKIAEYIKRHTQIPVYYYISPKSGRGRSTASRISNAMSMSCFLSCLSRSISSRSISIRYIMWAIRVWMPWMIFAGKDRKLSVNLSQPTGWKISRSSLCWQEVAGRKSRIT